MISLLDVVRSSISFTCMGLAPLWAQSMAAPENQCWGQAGRFTSVLWSCPFVSGKCPNWQLYLKFRKPSWSDRKALWLQLGHNLVCNISEPQWKGIVLMPLPSLHMYVPAPVSTVMLRLQIRVCLCLLHSFGLTHHLHTLERYCWG